MDVHSLKSKLCRISASSRGTAELRAAGQTVEKPTTSPGSACDFQTRPAHSRPLSPGRFAMLPTPPLLQSYTSHSQLGADLSAQISQRITEQSTVVDTTLACERDLPKT